MGGGGAVTGSGLEKLKESYVEVELDNLWM
jgi:hypothetical protein